MISPQNFATFITNVNTMVGATYATTPKVYPLFATDMPCKGSQISLGWTGMMPKPRAWFGPRVTHEPAAQTYTVVIQPWENTYEIDRFHLDDDQYGVYYRTLPDMARQWMRHPDYQFRDLLEGIGVQTGTRQNGFDGLTAFNTAHPVDLYDASKGTYSNDFIGGYNDSGTTVGGPLSPVAFTTSVEYMTNYQGEDGEALGVTPTHMMVPNTLRMEGELILKAQYFSPPAWGGYSQIAGQVGAADNVIRRFGVELIVNPLLKQKKRWYLFDCSKAFHPLLWFTHTATQMVPRTSEDDPIVFDTHKFLWGGWERSSPGWCYSWLFARSG